MIPHLGASTEESEDNCAVMAVEEIMDYLENGNIRNSVNYPACDMGVCAKAGRVAIFHKNIPNLITQFTAAFGVKDPVYGYSVRSILRHPAETFRGLAGSQRRQRYADPDPVNRPNPPCQHIKNSRLRATAHEPGAYL